MSDKDFAEQFSVLACEIAGADPSRAPLIERELRRRFGRTSVRIQPSPPVTLDRINAGLRAGCSVREIARDTGVSRSTIYRHLGRRKSQRAAT